MLYSARYPLYFTILNKNFDTEIMYLTFMLLIATKRAATKEDSIIFQASIAVNVVKTFHLHKKKVSESYEL